MVAIKNFVSKNVLFEQGNLFKNSNCNKFLIQDGTWDKEVRIHDNVSIITG